MGSDIDGFRGAYRFSVAKLDPTRARNRDITPEAKRAAAARKELEEIKERKQMADDLGISIDELGRF